MLQYLAASGRLALIEDFVRVHGLDYDAQCRAVPALLISTLHLIGEPSWPKPRRSATKCGVTTLLRWSKARCRKTGSRRRLTVWESNLMFGFSYGVMTEISSNER